MDEIKVGENTFYVGKDVNNPLAEITFFPRGEDVIVIDHTYVSPELRGKGVAMRLLTKVVEYARKEHLKIIPLCSYASKVMRFNDEYKDVLK